MAARPHVLACKSFIMGTCNLLIIGLPAGWRLGNGPFPPEVDRWRPVDGINWALSGRGSFRARRGAEGVEIRIHVEQEGSRAGAALSDPAGVLSQVGESGEYRLGDHAGRYALGRVDRGLGPWRSSQPALAVSLACPETARVIRLVAAADDEGMLREVLAATAAHLRCH